MPPNDELNEQVYPRVAGGADSWKGMSYPAMTFSAVQDDVSSELLRNQLILLILRYGPLFASWPPFPLHKVSECHNERRSAYCSLVSERWRCWAPSAHFRPSRRRPGHRSPITTYVRGTRQPRHLKRRQLNCSRNPGAADGRRAYTRKLVAFAFWTRQVWWYLEAQRHPRSGRTFCHLPID